MSYTVKYLVATLAFTGSLWLSYNHGVEVERNRAEAAWNKQAEELSNKNLELLQQVADLRQKQQTTLDKVAEDAEKKIALAETAANAADAAHDSVQQQAARLATKLADCNASASAERSKAAAASAMVLAELFRRADQRAGELGRAYDKARVAGLTCEKTYQALLENVRVNPK
ncbi:MAG: DUF2514 family protein [Aeromonas veronii]